MHGSASANSKYPLPCAPEWTARDELTLQHDTHAAGASAEVLHGDGQWGEGIAVNPTFGYHTVHRTCHKSSKIASSEASEDHKTEHSDIGKQTSDADTNATTALPWSRYVAILLPTTEMQMSIIRYLLRRTPLQIEHDAILDQRNHFALHTEQYLSKSQLRFINRSNFTVTNKIIPWNGADLCDVQDILTERNNILSG